MSNAFIFQLHYFTYLRETFIKWCSLFNKLNVTGSHGENNVSQKQVRMVETVLIVSTSNQLCIKIISMENKSVQDT